MAKLWSGMSDEAIKNALRIVEGHGFNATPLINGVSIDIPYSADHGRIQRVEAVECHSYREVFAALGY